MTLTLVAVRPASSRGGAVFGEHFEYRIRAASTADGYVVYDVILVRQQYFARPTGCQADIAVQGKADVELHRRLLVLYDEARSLTHPGGAFADPR